MHTGDGSTPTDEVFVQMDVVWAFLSSMTTPDNCSVTFPRHSQVTKLVLVLHNHYFSKIEQDSVSIKFGSGRKPIHKNA